jgi:alpha-ketoglutarate-dependent taurine dioxygenase
MQTKGLVAPRTEELMPGSTRDDARSATLGARHLETKPLSDAIGAEIAAVDLGDVSPSLHAEIRSALLKHHVLVFPNQRLTTRQIQTFAEMFGELEVHVFRKTDGTTLEPVHSISNLDAEGRPSTNPYLNSNYYWQSDKAYLTRPSWITMLYGVEIPPEGGDTQFANMHKAYEALPEATKREIAGLRVINSFQHMLETCGTYRLPEEAAKTVPPVEHPLVRTHPESGAKSLFITMYSREIVGMNREAGRALLDDLLKHATQPEFVLTVKWRQNDFVFWDNRSLVHRAIANYDMSKHRRLLQRVVVRGTATH